MERRTILLVPVVWLTLGLMGACYAQDGQNPFDLVPRLGAAGKLAVDAQDQAAEETGNPFDLVRGPDTGKQRRAVVRAPKPVVDEKTQRQQIRFGVVMFIFLLTAVLATLLRSFIIRAFQAFINDTNLNQLFREIEGRGSLPYWLLFVMFLFNAGIFVYFLSEYYEWVFPWRPFWALLYCVLGVTVLFLTKLFLVAVIGFIFPVEKETGRYTSIILIFSIILGLALVPVNIFLAYAPDSLKPGIVYAGYGFIALTYLIRSVRALFMANQFLLFHKFHFLLYICTVEIAPILIILKMILDQQL